MTTHTTLTSLAELQRRASGGGDRPPANAGEHAPADGSASRGELRLVNADPRYAHVRLVEPSPAGYLHVAVQTAAQARPGPVRGRDERREAVIAALGDWASDALRGDMAREAAVFRAALLAPPPADGADRLVQPDVALLVETATPAAATTFGASPEVERLLDQLRAAGARAHVLAARNVRRIGDVEHRQGGLYLFNHFLAADEGVAVALWERLAAWYERETGLDNSILLAPAKGKESAFALVNHARFGMSLPGLALRQFAKPSFYRYVQANLRANGVIAMPALYRLAWAGTPSSAAASA